MKLQKWIIDKYTDLYGLKTLKEISKDTGIQVTRVFRLMHGKEMKIGEFEIFQDKVFNNFEKGSSVLELANECLLKLENQKLGEIDEFLRRTLNIAELKRNKGEKK